MKILFAADGSPCTKKALAFLVTHEALLARNELLVLHVQPALPPNVSGYVGSHTVAAYQDDEASKVLAPIDEFLRRHAVAFSTRWVVGSPGREIVQTAAREGVHMIVMGTHGYGVVGRAVLGSVAQSVVASSEVPVLLIK
jgi:nucleotide-binding universal stress UspA family protein